MGKKISIIHLTRFWIESAISFIIFSNYLINSRDDCPLMQEKSLSTALYIYTSILMLIYIVFTTNNFFQPFVLWNQKTIKYDFSVTFFVWKKVCGRNTVACTYFHVKHWFRYHLCPAFHRLLVCVLSLSDLYWNDNKNKLWNKGSFLLFNAIFLYIALRNNPSS